MSSTAILAQKSKLRIETARAAAKVITGITAANPAVVSSTAHGYSNGDLIVVASGGNVDAEMFSRALATLT